MSEVNYVFQIPKSLYEGHEDLLTKCRVCGRHEYETILYFEPGNKTYICDTCLPEINKQEAYDYLQTLNTNPGAILKNHIPPMYVNFKLTDFQHPEKDWFNRLINHSLKFNNILIFGKTNTGKTTAMWLLVKHLILSHRLFPESIKFVKTYDLKQEFILANQENLTFDFEKYKMAKLLLIDDIIAANLSPAFSTALFAILDYRWEYRKSTIVSSDGNFLELAEQSKRIAARLERYEYKFMTGAQN